MFNKVTLNYRTVMSLLHDWDTEVPCIMVNLKGSLSNMDRLIYLLEQYKLEYKEEYSSFYVPMRTGKQKVTSVISKILRSKKVPNDAISRYCQEIAKCYEPTGRAKVFLANKSMLGDGILENKPTCLGEDGCNHWARGTIKDSNYMFLVGTVIKFDSGEYAKGRCIAVWRGTNQLYLTNFYGHGVDPAMVRTIVLEASRIWLNQPYITYRDVNVGFPFYQNGDTVVVSYRRQSRSRWILSTVKCGKCGDIANHDWDDTEVSYVLCDHCRGNKCRHCDELIDDEDDGICPRCRGDYAYCIHCNHEYYLPATDYTWIGGEMVCGHCIESYYFYCSCCDEPRYDDNEYGGMDANTGGTICIYCVESHYSMRCDDCGNLISDGGETEVDGRIYCNHCLQRILQEQE